MTTALDPPKAVCPDCGATVELVYNLLHDEWVWRCTAARLVGRRHTHHTPRLVAPTPAPTMKGTAVKLTEEQAATVFAALLSKHDGDDRDETLANIACGLFTRELERRDALAMLAERIGRAS